MVIIICSLSLTSVSSYFSTFLRLIILSIFYISNQSLHNAKWPNIVASINLFIETTIILISPIFTFARRQLSTCSNMTYYIHTYSTSYTLLVTICKYWNSPWTKLNCIQLIPNDTDGRKCAVSRKKNSRRVRFEIFTFFLNLFSYDPLCHTSDIWYHLNLKLFRDFLCWQSSIPIAKVSICSSYSILILLSIRTHLKHLVGLVLIYDRKKNEKNDDDDREKN